MKRQSKHRDSPARRQRGVVLLLALIMLVAMTLAGIVLYRQIGTGLIIARNLSFKRTATVAADRGIEAARTWLDGGEEPPRTDVAAAVRLTSWSITDPCYRVTWIHVTW